MLKAYLNRALLVTGKMQNGLVIFGLLFPSGQNCNNLIRHKAVETGLATMTPSGKCVTQLTVVEILFIQVIRPQKKASLV